MEPAETTPQAEPPRVLSAGQRRVVWGLLLGLMLLGTAFAPMSLQFLETFWPFCATLLCIGGLLAVTTLVAAWGALAAVPLVVRGPRTLGFVALLLLSFMAGMRLNGFNNLESTLFAGVGLPLFLEQGALFGLLRLALRWRLEWADQAERPATAADAQFTVRQALLWTTGVAGLLALGKYMPLDGSELDASSLGISPLILLAMIFPTAVAALGWVLGTSRRRAFAWGTACLTTATSLVLMALMIPNLASRDWFWTLTLPLYLQGGFLAVYLGTLGVMRRCGYRLVRRPKSPPA